MATNKFASAFEDLARHLEQAPFPPDGVTLSYGTAGFRTKAELLESTFLRMGALAALRSRFLGGAAVGLMVTASHNAEPDNGIKMVDASGGMLAQSWESLAQTVANARAGEEVLAAFAAVASLPSAPSSMHSMGGVVYVGRDTRKSSPALCALAVKGAVLCGAEVRNCELVTTPQLHHVVRMRNIADGVSHAEDVEGGLVLTSTGVDPADAARWAKEGGYFAMLAEAYAAVLSTASPLPLPRRSPLVVDASGGVGALQLGRLQEAIAHAAAAAAAAAASPSADSVAIQADASVSSSSSSSSSEPAEKRTKTEAAGGIPILEFELVNEVGDGSLLNNGCGAEFVQKGRLPPRGLDNPEHWKGQRLCSFDGDGDRLVYHYFDPADLTWKLLDGDKIATLIADFVGTELQAAGLLSQGTSGASALSGGSGAVKMGVVQTAYANGASTAYLRSKGLTLDFAKTGVKFVHHVAEKYDIGVYFEANGHGTCLFKGHVVDAFKARLASLEGNQGGGLGEGAGVTERSEEARERAVVAVKRLLALQQLVNQAVGDAISDSLCIEAILAVRAWGSDSSGDCLEGLKEWDALYADLPSRQSKLPVKDRTVVTCSDDETRTTAPPGLQERLNELMAGGGNKRCFVRPSGTEDVVRVYAEASTQEAADALADEAARAVFDFAGGVGIRP